MEADDGLLWVEGAGLGFQGHGHCLGKPALQAQGVQRCIDQAGVYLAQARTVQRVDILIPTAVPHVMHAFLDPPVIPDHPVQLSWCAPSETKVGQRVPMPRLTCPVAVSTVSFSTISACLAPGKPNPSRIKPAPLHRSRCAASQSSPLRSTVSAQALSILPHQTLRPMSPAPPLVPFDSYQIGPSVAHYGLAQLQVVGRYVHHHPVTAP